MVVSSTTSLTLNGAVRTITSNVTLDDIDANGIAWCEPVRSRFAAPPDLAESLGMLLNLATICRTHGRFVDELAALRYARRLMKGAPDLNALIATVSERLAEPELTSDGEYHAVAYALDPAAFGALLGPGTISANIYHPGSPLGGLLGIDGERTIAPDIGIENLSFHVCRGERRVATVPLVVHADNVGSWVELAPGMGGLPAQIFFTEACDNPRKVVRFIIDVVSKLMRSWALNEVLFQDPDPDRGLLHKVLVPDHDFMAELWDRSVVDLQRSEEELFAGIRKSYKSNVNWCRKNLAVEYLTGSELDDARVGEIYAVLQDTHRKLHERYGDGLTKPMFDHPIAMCRMRKGEVALTRTADGEACGITVTTDDGGIAFYALAGSKPIGNKNPGHFIVFDSILRAKHRGMKHYHVSRLFSAPLATAGLAIKAQSEHNLESIFFKRGFSDGIEFAHVYRLVPSGLTLFGKR